MSIPNFFIIMYFYIERISFKIINLTCTFAIVKVPSVHKNCENSTLKSKYLTPSKCYLVGSGVS